MAHKGRLIGAGGTALITLALSVYGVWMAAEYFMANGFM